MSFEKKYGGKWVEDDQDDTYVELRVNDITCAVWKVRNE